MEVDGYGAVSLRRRSVPREEGAMADNPKRMFLGAATFVVTSACVVLRALVFVLTDLM